MPASHKMLKSRQQAANRAAGIGDEQGRLPSRVKAAEVMARCTLCSQEIRMTKNNIEANSHFSSRHPTSTFATCFPGQFDPTAVASAPAPAPASSAPTHSTTTASAQSSTTTATAGASESDAAPTAAAGATASAPARVAKKKPAQDLSFLDAALDPKVMSGKRK